MRVTAIFTALAGSAIAVSATDLGMWQGSLISVSEPHGTYSIDRAQLLAQHMTSDQKHLDAIVKCTAIVEGYELTQNNCSSPSFKWSIRYDQTILDNVINITQTVELEGKNVTITGEAPFFYGCGVVNNEWTCRASLQNLYATYA